MTRSVVLGLLFSSLALPQFKPFASNSDGSTFLFASNLPLKTEQINFTSTRIFQHADIPILQPVMFPDSRVISAPFLSSDGQTTGYYAYYPCGGSCMGPMPRNLLNLRRNGKDRLFQAHSFVTSRNGRFVLTSNFLLGPTNLEDLDTGTVIAAPGTTSIADDGSALSVSGNQLLLTPFAQRPQPIFEAAGIRNAIISANGASAFVLTASSLIHIDIATRAAQTILDGITTSPAMTTDDQGQRLLLPRENELLLWDRTSGWRSLMSHEEKFFFSTLTGNGETVFAQTSTNRVYRLDANTGEATQLYAPFPSRASGIAGSTYPGSLCRFTTDYSGDELEIRVDSVRFPKVKSEPSFLDVQIPWESTEFKGQSRILEIQSPNSPFVLRTFITFAERPVPAVFTDFRTGRITATNRDFSQFITPENPARPGDLIHFWAAGLGPLDRPVATGKPGPADPPSRPLEPTACYIFNANKATRGLEIPTLIYAPNLIGVYQFDVIIPEDWPSGLSRIYCNSSTPIVAGGDIHVGEKL